MPMGQCNSYSCPSCTHVLLHVLLRPIRQRPKSPIRITVFRRYHTQYGHVATHRATRRREDLGRRILTCRCSNNKERTNCMLNSITLQQPRSSPYQHPEGRTCLPAPGHVKTEGVSDEIDWSREWGQWCESRNEDIKSKG